MFIGVLTLRLHLPGCRSLKEKRRRVGKLRDRFGKQTHISVCESDLADVHQQAEWSFTATAGSRSVVEQTLQQIAIVARSELDAVVANEQVDFI